MEEVGQLKVCVMRKESAPINAVPVTSFRSRFISFISVVAKLVITQLTITCSNSTIETSEKGVKCVQS